MSLKKIKPVNSAEKKLWVFTGPDGDWSEQLAYISKSGMSMPSSRFSPSKTIDRICTDWLYVSQWTRANIQEIYFFCHQWVSTEELINFWDENIASNVPRLSKSKHRNSRHQNYRNSKQLGQLYNQEASTQSSISGVSDGIRGFVTYGRYYKCSRSRYVSAKNTTFLSCMYMTGNWGCGGRNRMLYKSATDTNQPCSTLEESLQHCGHGSIWQPNKGFRNAAA